MITVRRMAPLLLFATGCMSWTIGPTPDGGTSDARTDRGADAPPFDCAAMLAKINDARNSALSCSGLASLDCPQSIGPDECYCPVLVPAPSDPADASTLFQDLVRAYHDAKCVAGVCVACPPDGGWMCKSSPTACAP